MKQLAMVVLIVACGSDSGDGGEAVAPNEATMLCDAFATHATACGWGGNVNQFDWNCGEAALVWRADVFRSFAQCATALECAGDGMACYQQARDGATALGYHEDYAAACQARVAECDLGAAMCNAETYELYTSAIVTALTACFDQPCAQIQTCQAGVL